MATKKGKISVHTDNLFPIIKKWLYSEHDIFLRELISNAHDAIIKLQRLSDMGEYKGKIDKGVVEISIDKKKKIISIKDNGLGMTEGEVEKYINQIAFSGAEEFVKKYKDQEKENTIIGHFGVGFFSSYMVAKEVEIYTLSYSGGEAVHWRCEGNTDFTIEKSDKKDVGTEIILHIDEESEKFLDEETLKELVQKYSNFLPIEINVNKKKANEGLGLWNKSPQSLKEKDYNEFYSKIFQGMDPLFSIHLNIDYPFKLKGILYFPKSLTQVDVNNVKGRIKLFCNNVFVSDNIINIIPQYLHLLQGVIDSPDIPLNVSRSALQADENVKKISQHIIKKVTEKLSQVFKKDRKKYEEYWNDLEFFVKFGYISDEKFAEKTKEILLFKKIDDSFCTLNEYKEKNIKLKDKVIYTNNQEKHHPYIEKVSKEELDVVVCSHIIDNHFIQQLEVKSSPLKFLRVDSAVGEKLLEDEESPTDDKKDGKEKKDEHKDFIESFKEKIAQKELEVKVQSFKDDSFPAMVTYNEYMRRFSEMSMAMSGGSNNMPTSQTLVLNSNNKVIQKLITQIKEKKSDDNLITTCKNVYGLALLQNQSLKGKDLSDFVNRISDLLLK